MVIFAWIILTLAVLGLVAVVLSKLPRLLVRPTARVKLMVAADGFLASFWYKIRQLTRWLWHFVLEAKDIRPTKIISSEMDKVKKVFRIRIRESEADPVWMPEVADHGERTTKTATVNEKNKTAEELY